MTTMDAQLVRLATRTLPLPGRIWRRLLSTAERFLQYPPTPFVADAHLSIGRFEIVNFHEYIQRNIYFLGYYEIRETRLVRRLLREGDVFIDIGANIGWFTVLAGRRVRTSGHVLPLSLPPESPGN